MKEKLPVQPFDEFKLVHDLLKATGMNGYGREFRLQLMKPDEFDVFRLYLLFQEKEYPIRVELCAYPFDEYTMPKVLFENLLPFCAVHAGRLHPNITDVGQVAWKAIRMVPGTTITIAGLLAMLRALLANPDHSRGVVRSCTSSTLSKVHVGDALVDTTV